ncbi:hypothetical protein BD560DRAFT_422728 [Blakeslea trispora]|nr:hypothetical protein BD560DRAFT_422728 [Blakeslea trispora]
MVQSNDEAVYKPSPRVLGGTIESVKKAKQGTQKQHDRRTNDAKTKGTITIGHQIKEVKKSLIIGKTAISMMMDRKLQKTLHDIGQSQPRARDLQRSGSKYKPRSPKPSQEQKVEAEKSKDKAKEIEEPKDEKQINMKEEAEAKEVVFDDTESVISFVSAVANQSPKVQAADSSKNEEPDELDLTTIELGHLDQVDLSGPPFAPPPPKSEDAVVLYKEANPDQSEFTSETWNAIFHPLSTFKHKKGELAYYPWSSANLPAAAAQVAQRVNCPLAYDSKIPNSANDTTDNATLPQVLPTPYLGTSPDPTEDQGQDGIQMQSMIKQDSQSSFKSAKPNDSATEEGHYFNMLQEIRGGNRYSTSSTESQRTFKPTKAYEGAVQWRANPANPNAAKINSFLKSINLRAIGIPDVTDKVEMEKSKQQIADPELLIEDEVRVYTIKRLFWLGFVCPFLWAFGSFYVKISAQTHTDPNVLLWQRRCRIALIYASLALAVLILVVSVNAAGAAAIRQTQTGSIRAVIAD